MPTASKPLIYLRFLKSYNYTPTSPDVNIRLVILICLFPWSTQTNIRSAPSLLCLYCVYTTLIRSVTTNKKDRCGKSTPVFFKLSSVIKSTFVSSINTPFSYSRQKGIIITAIECETPIFQTRSPRWTLTGRCIQARLARQTVSKPCSCRRLDPQ